MDTTSRDLDHRYGNIALMLWRSAERRSDQAAVLMRDRCTTYGVLRDSAAAVAESLRDLGIRPDDRVAVLLERGTEAVAALFGIMALGGIVVAINDRLRPRQMEHMLQNSGARALITTPAVLARNPRPLVTSAAIVDFNTIPNAPARDIHPASRVHADLVDIIYTSGSTGLPKGVAFSHGNLTAGIEIVAAYLGLRDSDRIASLLGFSSVYGLNQLLCAVRCGGTLVIDTSPVPHHIVQTMLDSAVTVAAAVPPLWTQLLSVPRFRQPIPSLRLLQNAGGHLPTAAVRELRRAQPQSQLFLQYGLTETFRSTFLPPDEVDRRPDCMGRAMPGTEVLVVRDDLTPCDSGEIGELVHRGPTVAAGYWNDPDATARVFRPNPFLAPGTPDAEKVVFSGDLVRKDSDGFLYYVSRRDRLIKTLGFRVGPDEIADVLFSSGEISECVVTTEADETRGERIVAYVVLAERGSVERLTRHSRIELPRYMQPARIAVLPGIPRLPSGKYDVRALSLTETVV